ncbi:MAG TPA: hypothetical protein VEO00_08135 [Actinomycetota bacterium]|nr:hypothetical protein [Actinomycetota bacterium]
MRRWGVVIVMLAAAAVPIGVLAATGTGSAQVNRQRFAYTTDGFTTTSTTFVDVPGLVVNVCSDNLVAANVGLGLGGAQVSVRAVADDGPVMFPGPVIFAPGSTTGFSFPFARALSAFEDDDSHQIKVQVRSTTGASVNVNRGTLIVQYQQGDQGCP